MKKQRNSFDPLGRLQITTLGRPRSYFRDFYHRALVSSWMFFLLGMGVVYLFINLVFAAGYFSLGNDILNAAPDSFKDSLSFAFETSSTVGYGHLSPIGWSTHLLSFLNMMVSLFFVAIITGFSFAKIARPTAKVLFSQALILSNYDGIPTLSFRVANGRSTHISDARVRISALIKHVSVEGVEMRRFMDLKLVRSNTPIFSLTWTIMHPIEQDSPLYGLNCDDMIKQGIEFFVNLNGLESAFSQNVHANYVYFPTDILEGHSFADVINILPSGERIVDYGKFHETKPPV